MKCTNLFLSLSFFISLTANAANEIKLAAGTSVIGYFKKMQGDFQKESGHSLVYTREAGLTAENSLMAVDLGNADVGIIGTSWEDLMKIVQSKKIVLKNLDKIQHQEIGKDRLSFIASPGCPEIVSKENLAKILTGGVTNWKDVGGPDQAIQIVMGANTTGTQKVISDKIMGGADFARKGLKTLNTYPEIVSLLASSKGMISFAPGGEQLTGVVVLKTEEIVRPIVAMTKGTPSEASKRLMTYFSKK